MRGTGLLWLVLGIALLLSSVFILVADLLRRWRHLSLRLWCAGVKPPVNLTSCPPRGRIADAR